ncbi:cytochrome-c peroxidase [Myroides odoratimimus]|uniref:cytochrome-c peroxidase n=1 Tax=Myroides odoratimimus TaxID=76832 RepID=UPI0025757A5D|nr:cytochrome-c peroxidase [Myroides odoratimimus]MDM1506221.1 cytochrome-c peroxidase [Myroides odoratimimus]MDM1510373.1 cytochrome-c peroxidase [Myroides odoratimimus]MDM1525997.1 cytochrome-c peroxidase [Myroides odoratimimus]MDM1537159.1 cytochrome-c peroxidase [Myroides odoratimimus]MDM1676711.1 cytochrome-c peroxidase [Myroides odoratimimus]
MKTTTKISVLLLLLCLISCNKDEYEDIVIDNPEIELGIPTSFPEWNSAALKNKPTKYGVELGEKLFTDPRLSKDNTISCSSCHIQESAYADHHAQAIGVEGRVGLRNAPPIQNLLFMKYYNWDGSKLQLENQPIVPIITHEEMNSSIVEVLDKIGTDIEYKKLFKKAYGDESMTPERIYKSIAQYEYTLISADSKYDRVQLGQEEFTSQEAYGYRVFTQKCSSCHSGALFTDQSFRNIGFPINLDSNEAGRARVTGNLKDYMSFRVPSLRNIEYTAPYGSFGQFSSLKEVLDYFDRGVLDADNLDPILKEANNRIALSEEEKEALIAFMSTLSDSKFIGK